MRRTVSGFTLIELLIVVAIIAILAAIAVPNFLEAQTRAKVSRVKADMRSLATAIESYVIDWNSYPLCNSFSLPGRRTASGDVDPDDRVLERLSTPVAYMTSAFLPDPFFTDKVISISTPAAIPGATPFNETVQEAPQYRSILYVSWDSLGRTVVPANAGSFNDGVRNGRSWVTASGGPDRTKVALGGVLANFSAADTALLVYDPTNGTISFGEIYRVGGSPSGDQQSGSGPYGGGFWAGVAQFQN